MKHHRFIQKLQDDAIVAAIRTAEAATSGEIRVFITRKATRDPLAVAQKQFNRMGMARTTERNGVLIFVAPRSQQFAIVGDQGIHERCGDVFWRDVADEMKELFRKSEFTAGIVCGVQKAGLLLAEHFPRRADDKNELPDAVERG
jgi:uncharacterized membrane protein